MTPPKARCVTCLEVILTHDPTSTTQRPKFCSSPNCRTTYKDNPICLRCRRPLHERKQGTRFHETCRTGCAFCGGWIPVPRKQGREHLLQPLYCKKECRDAAWEGQPMPICPLCEETVEFDYRSTTWRNPPLYHNKCNPGSRAQKRKAYRDEVNEDQFWNEVYLKRYLIDIRELYTDETAIDAKTGAPIVPSLTGLPVSPPIPFTDAPPFEFNTPTEPDHTTPTGGWAREHEIVDIHPDRPTDKADQYNKEWRYQSDDWPFGYNPYSARYVMFLPWHEGNQMIDLNPTDKR